MIDATRQPRERLCTACFTGKYPIELPGADKLGKNLLERTDLGGLPAVAPLLRPAPRPPAATRRHRRPRGSGREGRRHRLRSGPGRRVRELLTDADRVTTSQLAPTRKSQYDFRLPGR